MYDELIKGLRICESGDKCDLCPKWLDKQNGGLNACTSALSKDAADAIEGLSHAVDQMTEWRKKQWIPITERLPEEYGHYLVHAVGNGYCSTYIALWNGRFRANFEMPITHWMPLPEPPESEDE